MARTHKNSLPALDRLMAKVSPEPNSGCWLWMADTNAGGYGRIGFNGVVAFAHRVAYELLRGAIPPGKQLDHLCRVKCCVNPDHLEPVTARENMRRTTAWEFNTKKTRCPSGHPYTPENTYVNGNRRFCRACKRSGHMRVNRRKGA